jgi:hypothetical protein
MRPMGPAVRGVAGVLAFVLVALLLPGAPGAAAADGASLEIHSRICPVAYAGPDYYNVCHDDPLADVVYTLTRVGVGVVDEAVSPANGDLVFAGLAFGTYAVEESVPGDFADYRVYCSDQNRTEVPFVYTDTGGIQLDLAVAGLHVVCDWYVIPVDARGDVEGSLTIYKAVCPVGYAGSDFFRDCFGTPLPGIDFTFLRAESDNPDVAETDANGFVAFEGIAFDGTYVVFEDIPGEFNRFVVYCSAGEVAFPFAYAQNVNGIVLDLTTADDVRCDWYNVPADLRGETPTPVPTRPPTGNRPPVVRLPSTGDGPTAAAGASRGEWAALVVPLALVGFGVGVAARRRLGAPTR